MKRSLAAILICIQLIGCASKGSIQSADLSGKATQSVIEEVAVGKQIHQQIISRMVIYDDAGVNAYVTEIGKRLASHSKRKELPYQFIILNDDRIYATSAPGGFVYITSGFIRYVSNEAELAAVLAHEVAQLQKRDQRLSRSRAMTEKILTGGAAIAPIFGNIGALALLGLVGIYSVTASDPNSEKQLVRADRIALQMMNDAGYDPQGLVDLEQRVLNANTKELAFLYDYYQTRAVTTSRLVKLEHSFTKLNLEGKNFDSNRSRFLSMTQPLQSLTHT